MPQKSERQVLLDQLEDLLRTLAIFGLESTQEFAEIIGLYANLNESRYLNMRSPLPRIDGLKSILFDFPDRQFQQICRMDKASFVSIENLISNHPIFHNLSMNKQTDVWIQLMVVLNRLGCDGNGASIGKMAIFTGIGEGTVLLFTDRVFTAILSLKDKSIKWPNSRERRRISRAFAAKDGLENAVGVVDGTHIHFAWKPGIDGEVYWTRKSRYSLNVQLVCDNKGRIIYYVIGWPGSVFDSTVFGESPLFQQPDKFFSEFQYILGDAGYGSTAFICTPFRNPAAQIAENSLFNELFSSARVIIEHVNGILKGRFQSLKGVRILIKEKSDFEKMNNWILVCLILHNILLEIRDSWNEEEDDDNDDDESDDRVRAEEIAIDANSLRHRVQTQLLQWYQNLAS